jgi:mRNA interferase RelE/StbE
MPHRIEVAGAGSKDLARLPSDLMPRLRQAIDSLADQPRPPGHIKLRPSGPYRIRVGEYRVLYDIDDADRVVTVLRVRHRRDAYRGL